MPKDRPLAETALLLVPLILIALLWPRLPLTVPMHWNVRGEIDRWGSRASIFLVPVIAIALNVLLRVLPALDPKLRQRRDPFSGAALGKIRLGLTALFTLIALFQLATALGYSIGVRVLNSCVLLFLALFGNYSANLRPNYFAGIRTPWTLENPETWRATHRLGAKLIFFGALLLLILQFLVSIAAFAILLCGAVAALVLWSFFYSWHHFQRHAAAT
jgi:immunity protein, SdpI family